MLRADLIALGAEDHVLLLRMHHIAADAHSDRVLFDELAELYAARRAGREAVLAPLPIQYSDYAVWQRSQLRGERLDELIAYWAAQLEGAPALLRLPTDRPRPSVQRHSGAHHRLALPGSLGADLVSARSPGGRDVLHDDAGRLLHPAVPGQRSGGHRDRQSDRQPQPPRARGHDRLLHQHDRAAGRAGRQSQLPRRCCGARAEAALGAYAHQELPFEKVVEAVGPKRDASYNPIFQVNFRAQESQRPRATPGRRGRRTDGHRHRLLAL